MQLLPFMDVIHVPALGYSGGIKICWNNNELIMNPLSLWNKKFMRVYKLVQILRHGLSLSYILEIVIIIRKFYGNI